MSVKVETVLTTGYTLLKRGDLERASNDLEEPSSTQHLITEKNLNEIGKKVVSASSNGDIREQEGDLLTPLVEKSKTTGISSFQKVCRHLSLLRKREDTQPIIMTSAPRRYSAEDVGSVSGGGKSSEGLSEKYRIGGFSDVDESADFEYDDVLLRKPDKKKKKRSLSFRQDVINPIRPVVNITNCFPGRKLSPDLLLHATEKTRDDQRTDSFRLTKQKAKLGHTGPRKKVKTAKEGSSGKSCGIEGVSLGHALASKMLQQILQDMYIEPELLAELSEEQKQTLFCKMREEQVRKWREWEEEQDKLEKKKKNAPKKTSKKQLNWLLAQDGDVWVWVMGDHPEDKSIEHILQQEAQKEAQKQAEKEAEELRKKEEEEMAKKLKEEQERIEAEKKQKEEELRKKAEEAALYESLKEARELAKKVEEERKKSYEEERKKLKLVREKSEIRRRKSTENLRKMKEKRTSELYMKIEDVRKKFSALAEESGKKIEQDWKEQEKKVKQVDAERRLIARKAREEHRASLRSTATAITAFKSLAISGVSQLPETTNKESNKPINNNLKSHDRKRAARPKNRDEVVRWFRESEQPRGSGLDQDTGKIAPWFHGIISRQDAEDLLEDKKVGTYLMRVSERVWGYAISYRGQERCKHFLIDTSDDTYQFFGTNQIAHEQLADIVLFHQSRAISSLGQEILRYPCVQSVDPPDYYELFQDTGTTVTAL